MQLHQTILVALLAMLLTACGGSLDGGETDPEVPVDPDTPVVDPTEPDPTIPVLISTRLLDCPDDWGQDIGRCSETIEISAVKPGIIAVSVTQNSVALVGEIVEATISKGSLTPDSALTNSSGIAIFTLTANNDEGAGRVTVITDAAEQDNNDTLNFEIGDSNASITIVNDTAGTSLAQNSTALITVTLATDDGPYASPVTVTFSSTCSDAGTAELDASITSVNGIAQATYQPIGCVGDDVITANADLNSLSASTTVTVATSPADSIRFLSAEPTNIAIKGTGGAGRQETSKVLFKVVDQNGLASALQDVEFELTQGPSGTTIDPVAATTNANGEVYTVVSAGEVAGTVKVKVKLTDPTLSISSVSSELSVSTGLPDQKSFSVSLENFSPEVLEHDGVEIGVAVQLADHYNNAVPDGTTVFFQAEAGAINDIATGTVGSCTTSKSGCGVNWVSGGQEPQGNKLNNQGLTYGCAQSDIYGFAPCINRGGMGQPYGGRVTITAYTLGEENFVDRDADGSFTPAESFKDDNCDGTYSFAENFVDSDGDGVYTAAESFTDSDGNGAYTVKESYTDSDGNGAYTPGESYIDANGDDVYNKAEQFIDSNTNDVFDGVAEAYVDLNGDDEYTDAEEFVDSNGDGIFNAKAEDYVDSDNNGKYTAEESYTDSDGNGQYTSPESFTDIADIVTGEKDGKFTPAEPFTDNNSNGSYDAGEPYTDTNNSNSYDVEEPYVDANSDGQYSPGEAYQDSNNDGHFTLAEAYTDSDGSNSYTYAEQFTDSNNNGAYDLAEAFTDSDANGEYTPAESFTDSDGNGVYTVAETYTDTNGDGEYTSAAEPFVDLNGDGVYTATAEAYTDANSDGQYSYGETFTDLDGDGLYTVADSFTDANGDNKFTGDTFSDKDELFFDYNEDGEFKANRSCGAVRQDLEDDLSVVGAAEEESHDIDENGVYSFANKQFNGMLCSQQNADLGLCERELIHVSDDITLIMASSFQYMRIQNRGRDTNHVDLTTATGEAGATLVVYIADIYNNRPPAESVITVETSNGVISSDAEIIVPSSNNFGPYSIKVNLEREKEPNKSAYGTAVISITTPNGTIKSYKIGVSDDG